MAQPIDISNAAVHGHVAALAAHPGYYYLYALYADYPINNTWFRRREYAAVLQERLRVIQPLLGLVQPYRKSMALRLLTERSGVARFPASKVNEAYRELRALLEHVGPPPGWPHRPPPSPGYAEPLPPAAPAGRSPARPATPSRAAIPRKPGKPSKTLPKSPVDYTQEV